MNNFSISDFFQHQINVDDFPGIALLFQIKRDLIERIGNDKNKFAFVGVKSPVVKKAISELPECRFVNDTTLNIILDSLSNGNTFLVFKKASFSKADSELFLKNGTDMPWKVKLDDFLQKEVDLMFVEKCEPSNYIRIYEDGKIEFTYQKEEITF